MGKVNETKSMQEIGKSVLGDLGMAPAEPEDDGPMPDVEPRQMQDLSRRKDQPVEVVDDLAEEKIARLMQVLDRGVLNDKLKNIKEASTPDGYRGKFVRDTSEDIIRFQNLGFGFTYSAEARKGIHGTADGRIRSGDLVLMTIREEDWHILREVRRRSILKKLSAGKDEYKNRVAQGLEQRTAAPAFDESFTQVG